MNKKRQGNNGKVGSTLEDRIVQDISIAQDRPRQDKVGSWLILEDRAGQAFVRLWRIKRLLALVKQVIALLTSKHVLSNQPLSTFNSHNF